MEPTVPCRLRRDFARRPKGSSCLSDKNLGTAPKVNRQLEKDKLIQHLEESQVMADLLGLHLCAGLIDQALEQARRG